MFKIIIFSFISLVISCAAIKQDKKINEIIEFTSLKSCSSRGGGSLDYKSVRRDSTIVFKQIMNKNSDTLKYVTAINKWKELNSLVDFDEFKKEMQSVGGNHHEFDGCNNTFTIKTKDTTFTKYNSKITSDKLKQFYELYGQM